MSFENLQCHVHHLVMTTHTLVGHNEELCWASKMLKPHRYRMHEQIISTSFVMAAILNYQLPVISRSV